MNINPRDVISRGIVIPCQYTQVQMVGIDITIQKGVTIVAGGFASVYCNEKIFVPTNCYAQIIHRSSFNRKGIMIWSGIFDSGFNGQIGCTVYNHSGKSITIEANERIAQIMVFEASCASMYKGKYQFEKLEIRHA